MAKNSADYWRDREAAQRKKDIVDQMAYNREIRRIYRETLDNVQREIDAFYGRYAEKEGITLAEAKRRVSRIDMEAYERKAERYVKERDFSKQANEEMRLYNLTMKVNRLEMLKANIGLELIRGFDDLNKTFDEKLTRHATGEFERLAGILGDSVRNNSELAHAIVNASFHNATYSDRIWAYQDLLRDEIGKQVQTGLLQGRNSTELARAVQKRFDVSRSDAERLMMTEMRRVRTEVAKQSYEQNGNMEYQFLALGGNPCNECADLDGRVFPVKEMMPGANAPPMHPRCLCSTAPYWDEAKFQAWLDSGAAADGVPWEEFEDRLPFTNSEIIDNMQRDNPLSGKVLQDTEKTAILEQRSSTEHISLSSHNLHNSSDALYERVKGVVPIPGYDDVFIHGDSKGVATINSDGDQVDIPNYEFIKILKSLNFESNAIRLCACNSGAEDKGIASYIAREMNMPVMAPTTESWVSPPDRKGICEMSLYEDNGRGKPNYDKPGKWRIFFPDGKIQEVSE